jgi:hypothetical protein
MKERPHAKPSSPLPHPPDPPPALARAGCAHARGLPSGDLRGALLHRQDQRGGDHDPRGSFDVVWSDDEDAKVLGQRFARNRIPTGSPATLMNLHGGLFIGDLVGAWAGRYELAINGVDFGDNPDNPATGYRVSMDLAGNPLGPPLTVRAGEFSSSSPRSPAGIPSCSATSRRSSAPAARTSGCWPGASTATGPRSAPRTASTAGPPRSASPRAA